MNTLFNNEQSHSQLEDKEEDNGRTTFGDMFAISLVGVFAILILIVSSWSAISLLTGNTAKGGLIGIIFNKILSSGVV